MYYTIYKTTNTINNKIYVGCHKTEYLDDNYLGSGTVLLLAIKKYTKENFKKEILHIFDNPEDMFEMESLLVNEDFVIDKITYNLKKGGAGDAQGKNHLHNNRENSLKNLDKQRVIQTEKAKQRRIEYYNNPTLCKECGTSIEFTMGTYIRKFCSRSCSAVFGNRERTKRGWKHSEESKKKISDSIKNTRL